MKNKVIKSVNNNIPKRIKRHWGVTLFREQQSKAAEGQGRGKESKGRARLHKSSTTRKGRVPAGNGEIGWWMMKFSRWLILKGRLVSEEQGLFYFIFFWKGNVFIFFFFVLFQATTGSRSTVQSVGKEIPDRGKKKNSGMGRKEKSSKKHRSVNT